MTQGCKHNHLKMGNIFPLSCTLLLFKVFSKDAKTTVSLHLLSQSVPKFKRYLNQLKTTGQQNIPLILSKGCRSPENSWNLSSQEESSHPKSAVVTELAPTVSTGAGGGGGDQGQKLHPQNSVPQPAEAAGCRHYFPPPQSGIMQGSNMP